MTPLRGKIQRRIGLPAWRENAAGATGFLASGLLQSINRVLRYEIQLIWVAAETAIVLESENPG
jgi:hypothetical protein